METKFKIGDTVEHKCFGGTYHLKVIKISTDPYGEAKLLLDTTGTSLSKNSSVKAKNVKLIDI